MNKEIHTKPIPFSFPGILIRGWSSGHKFLFPYFLVILLVLGLLLIPMEVGAQSLFDRPLITGLNGMVTSNHPLATAAGMRILLKGGNAFDAAVATAAATSVVQPWNSSLGGNGFATLYLAASREVRALNFFGTAPQAAKPGLFTQDKLNLGIMASPVPSNLRGYQEMLEKYGTMKLSAVLEPAIELAERGFPATADFVDQVKRAEEIFRRFPTSARIFLPGGRVPEVGSLFIQKDYARTLRQVAERGPEDFYGGDLAHRIAKFYQEEGGILVLEDLQRYQARWLEPLSISYRGYMIYTQPPNSSAIAMLMQLNIMEGFDNKALGHNTAPYLHRFMEAQRLSLADRNKFVAASEAVPVPVAQLLSKNYARKQQGRIDPEKALPWIGPGDLSSSSGGSTTHLSVVDRAGNMVALTQTLGGLFGSYVIVGDTGLFFSNQMRHMHLDPESPSQIRGGVRPRSNQSPTIILKDGEAIMALGTPGGDGIWQRLAQVIVNVLDFGMNIQDAASAPRFTYGGHQETGSSLAAEWNVEDRIPKPVVDQLRSMGHKIKLVPSEGGGVNGIVRDPRTGALSGGADPRGVSYAIGY
jgi:gamma-glutamyltranspeptidase/glutathione hydrolase